MDLLSEIRRWHHRDKLPIREIRRRTGLSRNTIRKYLASDVVEPKYPPRKSVGVTENRTGNSSWSIASLQRCYRSQWIRLYRLAWTADIFSN